MKEEILIKAKIENLRTKIYLMIITLDLNLVDDNNDIQEAYNQEENLSEIFYSNLNRIGSPSVTPCPDEVHSTCNCKGAYVHQVPL